MADAADCRRCRDEQRSMTYREAVRLGLRRPWTEKQIEAARAGLSAYECVLASAPRAAAWKAVETVIEALCGLYSKPARRWRHHFTDRRDREHTWPQLRAWAERVLRETAELEGEA